jgi:hypothetical protein
MTITLNDEQARLLAERLELREAADPDRRADALRRNSGSGAERHLREAALPPQTHRARHQRARDLPESNRKSAALALRSDEYADFSEDYGRESFLKQFSLRSNTWQHLWQYLGYSSESGAARP